MKTVLFFTLLWFFALTSSAQYLKVDNGIVISSFHNKDNLPFLYSDLITTYSFSLGADYLIRKHFSISSQVGFMKLGGRDVNSLEVQGQTVTNDVTEQGNYIHFNTVGRISINLYPEVSLFVGIGPYVNILANKQTFNSPFFEGLNYQDLHWGGKAEFGITRDIDRFKVGLVGAYMHSLSPLVQSEFLSLTNRAYSVMITTGYRIR